MQSDIREQLATTRSARGRVATQTLSQTTQTLSTATRSSGGTAGTRRPKGKSHGDIAGAAMNLVETSSDDHHQSPCAHGNIVDGHACYCHAPSNAAPRKCPIWRNYGEADLSKWHASGDFDDLNWDGGCKWFKAHINASTGAPP